MGAPLSFARTDRLDIDPATGAELPESPVPCWSDEEENESRKSMARTRCVTIRLITCDWGINVP